MKKCDLQKKPGISCTVNSPYIVRDVDLLFDEDGKRLETKSVMSLCRCGESEKKPYCDNSHTKKGMNMVKSPDRCPDKNKDYRGKDITVHFNLGVCSHNGICLTLKPVFKKGRRPWIMPDLGKKEEIIDIIRKCPSGALSYTIDGVRYQDFDREPAIKIDKCGPFMIEGYIEFKDDQNSCPESKEHYCLCRCGKSKNHPFCDGEHLDKKLF